MMLAEIRRAIALWLEPSGDALARLRFWTLLLAEHEVRFQTLVKECAETRLQLERTNLVVALFLKRHDGVARFSPEEQAQLEKWEFASRFDPETRETILVLKEDRLQ